MMKMGFMATAVLAAMVWASIDARTIIYLTYDDGLDVHSVELAQWLMDQKDPITGEGIGVMFFVNPCRFIGANRPSPWTGNCPIVGYENKSALDAVRAMGHRIGNHTYDHVDLTNDLLTATEREYQIGGAEKFLAPYEGPGKHFFRAPYLSTDARLIALLGSNPQFSNIIGPVGCDVCGDGVIATGPSKGKTVGGDWDCLARFPMETCRDIYLGNIDGMARTHREITVLLHDNIMGFSGKDTALQFAKVLVPAIDRSKFEFRVMGWHRGRPIRGEWGPRR